MRISDWSSDVCSSDLGGLGRSRPQALAETVHLPFAGVDAEVDPLDHDVLDRALPSDLAHEVRRALPATADHVPGIVRRLHLQPLDVVRGPPAVAAAAGAGAVNLALVDRMRVVSGKVCQYMLLSVGPVLLQQ